MAEPILEQTLESRGVSLAYALQDDMHAKSLLQQVGGDNLVMTQVANTQYTLSSFAQRWLGTGKASIWLLVHHKEVLEPLGIYTIKDYEEAKPLLQSLGANPNHYKGVFYGDGSRRPCFISYRIILLMTLTSGSGKGKTLRSLMGISTRYVEKLLQIGGMSYLLERRKQPELRPQLIALDFTKKNPMEDPKEEPKNLPQSNDDALITLLFDDPRLARLKDRIQPKIDTLNKQIERLIAERDEQQKIINRINLLVGEP